MLQGSHGGQRQRLGLKGENQKPRSSSPCQTLFILSSFPWELFCLSFSPMSQPNSTLYINNLNDKINTGELRLQLYALFTTHGKIIDIVASKSGRMRGQAFLVFADLAGATAAMRACTGMMFYDKPLVCPTSPFSGLSLLSLFPANQLCKDQVACYPPKRRPQLCPPASSTH